MMFFVYAKCSLVVKRDGVDAVVGVDIQGAVNVFRGRLCIRVELDDFADGDDHPCFCDVFAIVTAFHIKVLRITAVDDQIFGGVIRDGHIASVRRAGKEIEM